MPMFWSKKSKAEKNYAQPAVSANKSGRKSTGKSTKSVSGKAKNSDVSIVATKTKAIAVPTAAGIISSIAGVIIRPRITEKSGILSQSGVYTFEVERNATKQAIGKAVRALYKVTPVKISVINNGPKKVFIRGRRGSIPGIRKAVITVKKGEKIDFV